MNSTRAHTAPAFAGLFSSQTVAAAMVIAATAAMTGCAGFPTAAAPDRAMGAISIEHPPPLIELAHAPDREPIADFASYAPHADRFTGVIHEPADSIERVTTAVPWPRGVAVLQDGTLIALARGRHRSGGGVPDFDDKAGTLFAVDVSVSEPLVPGEPAGQAVRTNVRRLAAASMPPFFPHDPNDDPERNTLMTRPYCGLDYDPVSRNIIICAFSGAELDGGRRFRKHATDSLLRFDLRDESWHVIEQHDHRIVPEDALGRVLCNSFYPHHDPEANDPPHGWLNGPTDCTIAGRYLYATSKDNHLLVQYDLTEVRRSPDAGPAPSRPVLGPRIVFRLPDGQGGFTLREMEVLGASGVAACDEWLYFGSRTTSIVYRVPIDETGDVRRDQPAELIGIFEPWCPERRRSGNMFDLAVCPAGDVYVAMVREGRVWRITPDPANPFYADDQSDRPTTGPPFLDLSALVGKHTGAGNITISEDGWLYVCTRNNDIGEGPIDGTIYRARID